MRFFSLRRSAHAFVSFAGAGIARSLRHSGHGARHTRRRTGAGVVHLSSERLEGRSMLAPVISAVIDDVAPVTGAVLAGGSTNDTNLAVTITLGSPVPIAGDVVELLAGGTVIQTSPALITTDISSGSVTIQTGVQPPGSLSLTARISSGGTPGTESPAYTVTIDTAAPTVALTASSMSLNVASDTSTITLTFSEPIAPGLLPTVTPSAGTIGSFTAGGGNTYTATYFAPTSFPAGNVSFTLGSFADAAGNVGSATSIATLTVDTQHPTATRVTNNNAPGTYFPGQSLSFTVNFNEPITTNGPTFLRLRIGSNTPGSPNQFRYATAGPVTGAMSITYTYTIDENIDTNDNNGVEVMGPVILNGSTLADLAGNAISATATVPPVSLAGSSFTAGTNDVVVSSVGDLAVGMQISSPTAITARTITAINGATNTVSFSGPAPTSSVSEPATFTFTGTAAPISGTPALFATVLVIPQQSPIGVFTGVTQGDRLATPISTLSIRFDDDGNPLTPPPSQLVGSGNALVGLDDFVLTRNGSRINITAPATGSTAAATLTYPLSGNDAFARFQIGNLEQYTNEPGTYRMTFNDAGVSPAVSIEWVKSVQTAGELVASLTPSPTSGTTPRSSPVNSVQVVFQDNTGTAIPVTGVNTAAGGATGITQFTLFRNGVPVVWQNEPKLASVSITGSGSTYSVNGLTEFTTQPGTYMLMLNNDPAIQSLAGVQMITSYGVSWEIAPTTVGVTSVSPPASGTFSPGTNLDFTVVFGDALTYTAGVVPATLSVAINGVTRQAVIQQAAGTRAASFTFRYTTNASDATTNPIAVTGINRNGGTFRDAAGFDAALTGATGSFTGIVIRTPAAPTVNPLVSTQGLPTLTGTALLLTGETLSVRVNGNTYSNVVPENDGTWSLNMATVNPDGSTTPATALTNGTYSVIASIRDVAANQYFDTTTNELVIDSTAPTVVAVTSNTPDGSYRVGGTVSIQVQLSKIVAVNTALGSPTLTLNTTPARNATFVNAVGNVLTFTYTIAAGDNAADLNATTLVLNGATIRDTAGNNLTLTLPASQAAGSLDAIKDLVVDTTAPTAPVVTPLTTNVTPPTISGTATLATGETLRIVVNGATYDNVTVTGGAWSIDLATIAPTTGTLGAFVNNTSYPVTATVTDAAGNVTTDVTTNELRIVTAIPAAPTVNALVTNSLTPTLTGTATLTAGQTLSVIVGGATYSVTPVGGTWSLNLATTTPTTGTLSLTDGDHNVVATISDTAGNAASDTTTNELTIDTTAPTVVAVTSNTPDGSYRVGGTVLIQVQLSKIVAVNTALGSPTLTLNTTPARNATFVNAVGNVLTFTYTIAAGDNAADLNATTLVLNGATISDAAGNNLTLTLPASQTAGSLDANKDLVVDTTAPTAPVVTALTTNVTPPTISGTATLAAGENLSVSVNGAIYTNVPVSSGAWSINLATVAPSSGTLGAFTNGDVVNVTATVTDAAGNSTSDATTNELRILVPTNAITTFNVPSKTYRAGDVIEFTVSFASPVDVNRIGGTPRIQFFLDSSGTARNANYTTGTGTTLRFSYTVVAGDFDNTGIDLASVLIDQNGGTITTVGGAPISLEIPTSTSLAGVLVDGVAPRAISPINGPTPGTYVTGVTGQDTLVFVVPFNDVVTVAGTGTPAMVFTLGSNTRQAVFSGPSGFSGTQLEFRYTIQPGDTGNSISIGASPIQLNGVTIQDANGNNADLSTITATTYTGVIVNLTSVTAVALASADNRYYRAGETIRLTATFDAPVTVTGSPAISITVGSTPRPATYSTGSGTKTLTFTYTVVTGDLDLDGLQFASTAISGGGITNAGGSVLLSFVPPDISGIRVDAVSPFLATSNPMTVPAGGNYKAGDTLQFTVAFNESVRVTPEAGTGNVPRIALVVGSRTRYADFVAGNETPVLVFDYIVANDDLDLNGIVVGTAISLNGAKITDLAGNAGSLVISPPPTNTVLVDGISPTITRFAVPVSTPNGSYGAGRSIPIVATMSKIVTSGSTMTAVLDTGAVVLLTAGTQGTTLTGTYTVAAGENSSDLNVVSIDDASVTDVFGNRLVDFTVPLPPSSNSIAGARAIVIDTIAPAAPTVTPLLTNNTRPTLNGTATLAAGETLSVTINGFSYNVPVVAGAWTLNLASTLAAVPANGIFTALTDGEYSVTATVTDAAGNATSDPTFGELTVDTTPPATPDVTPLTTNATKPTLTGTAALLIGDTLRVAVNGFTYSNVPVLAGTWSINLATATPDAGTFASLTDGSYVVTATAQDSVGNTSTGNATLRIDTVAPAAPAITGTLPSGSRTNVATPTFSGSAEAGSTVTVRNGGTVLGTTVANGSGFWSLVSSFLADASYTVTATATDLAGNTGPQSAAYAIAIDTVAPGAPAITGLLASGSRTNVDTPTFSGTAEAGSTVTVRSGGSVLGTAVANGSGAWSLVSSFLTDATYTVTATATDLAGNTGGASAGYSIIIDTAAPAAPLITGTLPSGSRTNVNIPTFSGTAEAGSTVIVRNGGTVLGTAIANGSGAWSLVSSLLADGAYSLTATATDATGNTGPQSATYSIAIDTVAPGAPAITGLLASGSRTNVATPTFSGTAEAGSTVTVRSGGSVLGTAVANGSGAWSLVSSFLTDATYTVTATATDLAGNTGGASAGYSIIIDTAAPAAPLVTGNLPSGSRTNVNRPTFSGTAEAGSTVTVRNGGTVLGTAVANGSGAWSLVSSLLADGAYSLTATATDATGNTGPQSAAYAIAIDTAAPAAPMLALANDTGSSPTDGTTSVGTFNVAGIESGANWQFSTDGVNWTNGTGTSFNLGEGNYAANAIRVRQTDAAGNTGPSGIYAAGVTVDNAAPSIVGIASTSSGTRSAGETVVINATVSEPVQAGSSITVTLDTGNVVTLVAAQAGTTLTGSFVIQPGQVSTNLRVIALGLTNSGARDIAGNPIVSTAVPNNSLGAIDAAIKVAATGFSSDPNVVMDKRAAVRSIPVTFSTPVTGFTLANLRLTVNGRSVSLRGATLRGSGTSYTLLLPARATNLNGIYTLQIGGQGPAIRATANGVEMIAPSTIYWGKGRSVGIAPAVKAATFAAAAKPAPKPRAAAFRTMR